MSNQPNMMCPICLGRTDCPHYGTSKSNVCICRVAASWKGRCTLCGKPMTKLSNDELNGTGHKSEPQVERELAKTPPTYESEPVSYKKVNGVDGYYGEDIPTIDPTPLPTELDEILNLLCTPTEPNGYSWGHDTTVDREGAKKAIQLLLLAEREAGKREGKQELGHKASVGGKFTVYGQIIDLVKQGHTAASIGEWAENQRDPSYMSRGNKVRIRRDKLNGVSK